jgi:hypothetical protein
MSKRYAREFRRELDNERHVVAVCLLLWKSYVRA